MNLNEQAARLEELRGEILTLAEAETLSPEDEVRYVEATAEFDVLRATHDQTFEAAVTYAAKLDEIRSFAANTANTETGDGTRDAGFQIRKETGSPFEYRTAVQSIEDPARRREEFRGRALKAAETGPHMTDEHRESVTQVVERDGKGDVAQYILDHGSPEYHDAFRAAMRNPLGARSENRAALSLTGANGGYLVPFTLDPSIILTNNGATNPFRGISKVVQITTDDWNGVSSAGVTAEWIAESTQVADASPTFAQPSITVYKADAYIQASLEVVADSAVSGEISMLIADAKDRLEATAFATGTGSGQPYGIVTALGLTTTSRVAGSSGAAGAADLVAADIYALDNDLGDRYRQNASFVGNKKTWNTVRQFGTANNYHAFWTDFGGGLPSQLIGYPVYQASAMDSTIVSGSNDDVIVLGDFQNYVVVDRMGLELVYNPLVMGANNRPSGEVGWVAFWRTGGDSVNDAAFRMLRV